MGKLREVRGNLREVRGNLREVRGINVLHLTQEDYCPLTSRTTEGSVHAEVEFLVVDILIKDFALPGL